MSRHHLSGSSNAIAWALLSQTLWLPLLAIDLHDHWQARVREQQEIAAAAARIRPPAALATAQAPREGRSVNSTGVLLSAAGHGFETASQSLQTAARDLSSRIAGTVSRLNRVETADSPSLSQETPAPASRLSLRPITPPGSILSQGFSRSELLGGSLSLADLHRPPMPALAMAEQARWSSSGDPLAPLPSLWREPMRKALRSLAGGAGSEATISTARVIHVPSSRVKTPTTVPLAIQRDGSVDILSRADDPGVVDEIRDWSRNQTGSSGRGVTAALVHLEPLPAPAPVLVPERPVRSVPAATGASLPATGASSPAPSRQSAAPQPPTSVNPTARASQAIAVPEVAPAPSRFAAVAIESPAAAPAPVASTAAAPAPEAAGAASVAPAPAASSTP